MAWKRAQFKGKKVWAEVGEDGRPKVQKGLMSIRYSPSADVKIYNARVTGVMLLDGPAEVLPAGAAPDGAAGGKRKKSGSRGSGFGKAGTRTAAQASAARQAASDLVASFHRSAVLCFTDGACKGNPGPAGSGAVVKLPDGTVYESYRSLGRATNNVGELTAIELALDILDQQVVPGDSRIEILTDSKYTHGLLMLGWRGKANQALIRRIKSRIADFPNLRIHWIAGHVGIPENERADALANMGVAESGR